MEHIEPAARRRSWRRALRPLSLTLWILVVTVIAIARRPDEFHAPYVWGEESLIVHGWLDDGWRSVFHPIQGDLMPFTAASIGLASDLSWLHFPSIDYVTAVLTFAVTCALLLVRRSRWGGLPVRAAMVLFLALVPIDPETYDVALYTFWWTSLWPLIVLGWEKRPGRLGWLLIVVSGLNSLAGAATFVVFLAAGVRERSRSMLVAGGVLGGCALVHTVLFLRSDRYANHHTDLVKSVEQSFVNASEFVVRPLIGERPLAHLTEAAVGAVVIAVLFGCALALRGLEAKVVALEILAVSGLYSLLSSMPAPFVADPILAGGRYFFLPFAAWGILLIHLLARTRREAVVPIVAAFMLAWSLSSVPKAFNRHSERIEWRAEVAKCARSGAAQYPLPIQTTGRRADAWSMPVSPDLCRRAIGR